MLVFHEVINSVLFSCNVCDFRLSNENVSSTSRPPILLKRFILGKNLIQRNFFLLKGSSFQVAGVDYVYFKQKNSLDRRNRTLLIEATNISFAQRIGVKEDCNYYVCFAINTYCSPDFSPKCSKMVTHFCAGTPREPGLDVFRAVCIVGREAFLRFRGCRGETCG